MKINAAGAVLLCLGVVLTTTPIKAAETKDTIRIGVFLESIYDLDFANYSYSTNFWMWSVARGDINGDGKIDEADSLASMDRISSIELSNAKKYKYYQLTTTRAEVNGKTYWWAEQFCRADIYQKWHTDNYPFDRQVLRLKFEDAAYDTSQVIMLNKEDSLTFKKDINLIGWEIHKSRIRATTVNYNTDFGDPNGHGKSSYSRVTYGIELRRIDALGYFLKLTIGMFISFLVALLVFAISTNNADARFGLGIGALFAVVANKYVVDANIPETATNCMVDILHEITFVYLLLTLIGSAISVALHEKEKHRIRKIFDRSAGAVLLLTYIAIVVYYLMKVGAKVDV